MCVYTKTDTHLTGRDTWYVLQFLENLPETSPQQQQCTLRTCVREHTDAQNDKIAKTMPTCSNCARRGLFNVLV